MIKKRLNKVLLVGLTDEKLIKKEKLTKIKLNYNSNIGNYLNIIKYSKIATYILKSIELKKIDED